MASTSIQSLWVPFKIGGNKTANSCSVTRDKKDESRQRELDLDVFIVSKKPGLIVAENNVVSH